MFSSFFIVKCECEDHNFRRMEEVGCFCVVFLGKSNSLNSNALFFGVDVFYFSGFASELTAQDFNGVSFSEGGVSFVILCIQLV